MTKKNDGNWKPLTTSQITALQLLQEQFNRENTALARTKQRLVAVMQEAGLDPNKTYDVNDDGNVTEKA